MLKLPVIDIQAKEKTEYARESHIDHKRCGASYGQQKYIRGHCQKETRDNVKDMFFYVSGKTQFSRYPIPLLVVIASLMPI